MTPPRMKKVMAYHTHRLDLNRKHAGHSSHTHSVQSLTCAHCARSGRHWSRVHCMMVLELVSSKHETSCTSPRRRSARFSGRSISCLLHHPTLPQFWSRNKKRKMTLTCVPAVFRPGLSDTNQRLSQQTNVSLIIVNITSPWYYTMTLAGRSSVQVYPFGPRFLLFTVCNTVVNLELCVLL